MMCVTVAQPGGAFWFVATMINGPGRRGGILARDAKPTASVKDALIERLRALGYDPAMPCTTWREQAARAFHHSGMLAGRHCAGPFLCC
jgi:hypothetical protein